MQVLALLTVYNEERFIESCLRHMIGQGLNVYLFDNESTDKTVEAAKSFLGRGLINIESVPRHGVFSLRKILENEERVAAECEADWIMHMDADEVRLPPESGMTLVEAFECVENAGYNAVNFMEFTFVPTRESPDHDHRWFHETMRWYYPFAPYYPHRVNAWRRQEEPVDLRSSGGHVVRFPGLRLFPRWFPMRHYLFLSREHAVEKYVSRQYDPGEVKGGWHGWRAALRPEDIVLPAAAELRTYVSDDGLDASDPRKRHYVDESRGSGGVALR